MLKKVCLPLMLTLATAPAFAENIPFDQAKEAGVAKCLPMIKMNRPGNPGGSVV